MSASIRNSKCLAACASAVVTIISLNQAVGQQPRERAVEPAAFSRPESSNAAQRVHFSRQPAQAGDVVEQDIGLEMRLTMSMLQARQVTGKNQTSMRTSQRRVITTTEVDNGRTTAVTVHYSMATKQTSAAEGSDTLTEPEVTPQPVHGKTYVCRRENGENGPLIITDEAGNRPPTDEYEMVSQQMQMIGRANPLAQFLAGRAIAVGESVELPNEVATQIFNLSERFGKVSRFNLKLQKVLSDGGTTRAVFIARVDAVSSNSTQMRLEMEGPLVVDVASCRAQRINLVGPIGMSETRGSYSTAYQMIGTGRLQMSIASNYRDANR